MEQDRDTRDAGISGIGYRLAAPALRAKQRQNFNQSALDFADPGWDDGPRAPDLGDVAQDRWHASEEPAFSVSAWLDQVRDLPWHRYVGTARRASLVGAMGAVGFAFVMYQALPRPASKTHAAKAEPVEVADAAPPTEAAPAIGSAAQAAVPVPAAEPPAPVSPSPSPPTADATPAAASVPPSPAPASQKLAMQTPLPPEAAPVPDAVSPAAPAQLGSAPVTPAPAPPAIVSAQPRVLRALPETTAAPRAAGTHHGPKAPVRLAVQTRPNTQLWRPIAHPRPAATLAQALPPRAPAHHYATLRGELPRWLTEPHPATPRVLVMSEPPHNLSLPPTLQHEAMATAPARIPGIVLPALRAPGFNAAPPAQNFAMPRYSGVYYGGYVPQPVPSEPQG